MGVFEGQAELGKFVFEKTEIESGVVSNHGIGADEAVKFGENPGGGRLAGKHFIADAVDALGGPGNGLIDLDEALEFLGQATVFDSNGANFNDPITVSGRETGSFKIKDNETWWRLHKL